MIPKPALALAALLCTLPSLAAAEAARAGPYEVTLVDASGATLPTFEHRGRTYVLGAKGDRYLVRVRNRSDVRIEVVVSVDGRDVLDGRPSDWAKRGYLVPARGEITIDGYRLDLESAAAFRFSDVPRSYAARTGDARDVGVVGVAVFPEAVRHLPWSAPGRPHAMPEYDASEGASADGRAPPAPSASAAPEGELRDRGASRGRSAKAEERPGLGTEFGERVDSEVREVPFERASRTEPAAVLALRYDDRRGLRAAGVDLGDVLSRADDTRLRETADPFRRNSRFAAPPPGWRH